MSNVAAQAFCRELHKQTSYWAPWLPTSRITIGDIGINWRGQFKPLSSLPSLGVAYSVDRRSHAMDFLAQSKSGFGIATDVMGAGESKEGIYSSTNSNQFESEIRISFNERNRVLFGASVVEVEHISALSDLSSSLINLLKARRWNPRWYVVTEVLTASSMYAFVSGSADARVTLASKQKIQTSTFAADICADLGLVYSSGMAAAAVVTSDTTPLFRLHRLSIGDFINQAFGFSDFDALSLMSGIEMDELESIVLVEADPSHEL